MESCPRTNLGPPRKLHNILIATHSNSLQGLAGIVGPLVSRPRIKKNRKVGSVILARQGTNLIVKCSTQFYRLLRQLESCSASVGGWWWWWCLCTADCTDNSRVHSGANTPCLQQTLHTSATPPSSSPSLPWFTAEIFNILHPAIMKTHRAEEFHSGPDSRLGTAREIRLLGGKPGPGLTKIPGSGGLPDT